MTDSTKTQDVTEDRQAKPFLANLNCMIRHSSLRAVLNGKEPVALECTGCGTTWTVKPTEAPAPERVE